MLNLLLLIRKVFSSGNGIRWSGGGTGWGSRLTEGAKWAGVYCIDRIPPFKQSLKNHCFKNKVVSAVSAGIKTWPHGQGVLEVSLNISFWCSAQTTSPQVCAGAWLHLREHLPACQRTKRGRGGRWLCGWKALSQLWTTERLRGLCAPRLSASPPSPPPPPLLRGAQAGAGAGAGEEKQEEQGCSRAGLPAGTEGLPRASGEKLGPCL